MIKTYLFIKEIYITLAKARISYLAASIAYFMALSLIPILMILVSVLGFIAKNTHAQFSQNLIQLFHCQGTVMETSIIKYIEFASVNKSILGLLGLLVLFWTSKGVIFSLEYGIDKIMATETRKAYWRKLIDSFIMILVVVMLFGFSLILTTLANYTNSFTVAQSLWRILGGIFPYIVSTIISVILFYAIYRIIPLQKSKRRHALIGASIGAILWQIITTFLSLYLTTKTQRYEFLYGSFAVFIYTILWSYFFALCVLIGSAIIKSINKLTID